MIVTMSQVSVFFQSNGSERGVEAAFSQNMAAIFCGFA